MIRIVVSNISTIICFLSLLQAQSARYDKALESNSRYPIPGSHLLEKDNAKVSAYFSQHPQMLKQMKLRKAAWNFVVGSTHTWKAADFTVSGQFLNIPSTCRAVGTWCYIFAEDKSWNDGKITQAIVDSVKKAFDESTPANLSKGIYQMNVDAFGDPPNFDGDPKIIILILDIKDGYDGTGGYIAGFFHSINQLPKDVFPNSNEAEIYYLDCNPANLTTSGGLADGLSTTAHEFQHMIHWNYDMNEMTFVNEGCSLIAEVNAGYPLYNQNGFTNEPNHFLFDWRSNTDDVLKDYSRAARYMVYLRDQFTINIFKPLVQSSATGSAGIDTALRQIDASLRFTNVTRNWLIANGVNNQTVNVAYGYSYPTIALAGMQSYVNPNTPSTTRNVQGYAADYLSFDNGANLEVTFLTPSNSSLEIIAVKIGTEMPEIETVEPGTPYTVAEFGSKYSNVRFIVLNALSSNPQNYTVQSTGTATAVALQYDFTEPTGYLALDAGDTVCVVFDAVPGARLDSIRVALRRAGTMIGGIWKYTGTIQPTPLGMPYVKNISATVSSTPGIPYPIPWPNWATINLVSHNIVTSDPFAVAFSCSGEPTVQPRVMITESPVPGEITSFTYLSSERNWYYLVSNEAGDSVFTYLIRAYISFPDSSKIELTPNVFTLYQNFPNPFNPGTTIKYYVPIESHVTIKVFDMLGREVLTLVNEVKPQGHYNAYLSASGLASGAYFYRLTGNGFSVTKKMSVVR